MREFEDKVAVITGGAAGIGRALALDFARRGMKIVLADIDGERLERTAQEILAVGAPCLALTTDVARRDEVQSLADAAYDRFGAVHVLCNNAGVLLEGAAQDAAHAEWQWILGVNMWGVIHGVHAFLPRMLAGGQQGHIVNTASMAGMIPFPEASLLNTSKYAVVGLTETMSYDLRETPVGVTLLCPMWVRTDIFLSGKNMPPIEGRIHEDIDMSAIRAEQWKTPAEVSAMVMAAIEEDRFYVFTHKESREYMEARIGRIQAAYLR